MTFYWSWDAEFLGNVLTLLSLGGSFAYFAHVVFTRNKAGRFDRLVWGLLGLFNAMVILTVINVGGMVGLVPDEDWIKWPARIIATACAINGAIAAKNADPLVYLSDLRHLNQRILNKRAAMAQQSHDIAVLRRRVEQYERVFGPLPD